MENPYAAPAFDTQGHQSSGDANVDLLRPLYDVKGWMKFLGVLNIIFGVLYCLSIVGAIIGWVPILIGIRLNGAASKIEEGLRRRNAHQASDGARDLASAIKIFAILVLVMLLIWVAYFMFMILFFLNFAANR